jgi:hypothetical protein
MGPHLQVGGAWDIVQSNGFRVAINVMQDGDQLGADATHSAGRVVSTEARGFVRGRHFEITITWNNGTRGEYKGDLTHGHFTPPPIGFLKGTTRDLNNPLSTATWQSEGRNFQVG